jgi:ribonuclease HI
MVARVSVAQNGRVTDGEVIRLECELLDPANRGDAGFLERVLHPDFEEFGASGWHWNRAELVAMMLADPGLPPSDPQDFRTARLGPEAILLTYSTRTARRSSVWLRTANGWQVRFHQGTPHAGRFEPGPLEHGTLHQ